MAWLGGGFHSTMYRPPEGLVSGPGSATLLFNLKLTNLGPKHCPPPPARRPSCGPENGPKKPFRSFGVSTTECLGHFWPYATGLGALVCLPNSKAPPGGGVGHASKFSLLLRAGGCLETWASADWLMTLNSKKNGNPFTSQSPLPPSPTKLPPRQMGVGEFVGSKAQCGSNEDPEPPPQISTSQSKKTFKESCTCLGS